MPARVKTLMIALTLGLAAAGGGLAFGGEPPGIMTGFSILIGFPSAEGATDEGVLLVPGTVIPVGGGEADAAALRSVVERSLAFTAAVDRLWSTFRLDPGRQLQRGAYLPTRLDEPAELPQLEGTDVRMTATLLGFNDGAATYRVAFQQGGKTLADSTVTVNRGGRTVVGGMDGEAAPYIFVFVEPDPVGSGPPAVRFLKEGTITEPVVRHKVAPAYPEAARAGRVMGMVVLDLTVGAEGKVTGLRVLESPSALLSEAAIEAVRQWEFDPARRDDGTPVSVLYVVTIRFALQ
jgi:TonB family protein